MKIPTLKLITGLGFAAVILLGCAENKPAPVAPATLGSASTPAATASPSLSASPESPVQLQLGSEPTRPAVDPSVNRAGRIHHHSHSARHPFNAAPAALNVRVPIHSRTRHRTAPHAPKPPRLTKTKQKSVEPQSVTKPSEPSN